MSRTTVGNVEIVALLDTPMEFPWSVFFPAISLDDFNAYRDLYPGAFTDSMFQTNAHCYALRSQGKTVLVDTGVGPGPIAWLGGKRGQLLDDMKAKGVPPDSVDIVAMTHLHGDHVGWNLTPDGQPTFANARYLVPRGDWDFFSASLAANPQMEQVTPLKELGVMDLYHGEHAVTADITALPTPGHTPGHHSFLVASNGERALLTGDLAHHPAQVDRTDWCSAFDSDPALATTSRAAAFDRMEAEGILGAFCHFPNHGFGRLVRLEGKRVFQAL